MKSHSLQGLLAHLISFRLLAFCMVTAIYFYNQSTRLRKEIYDEIAYHMLSEESNSHIILSKVLPHDIFCQCSIPTILQSKSFQQLVPVR